MCLCFTSRGRKFCSVADIFFFFLPVEGVDQTSDTCIEYSALVGYLTTYLQADTKQQIPDIGWVWCYANETNHHDRSERIINKMSIYYQKYPQLEVNINMNYTIKHHFEVLYFCFMKILNFEDAPLSVVWFYFVFFSLFLCIQPYLKYCPMPLYGLSLPSIHRFTIFISKNTEHLSNNGWFTTASFTMDCIWLLESTKTEVTLITFTCSCKYRTHISVVPMHDHRVSKHTLVIKICPFEGKHS